jgi:hypothetical protein
MGATQFRFAYRCLPLTIANSMGWELLCPAPVEAEWNGGVEISDIEVTTRDGSENWFAQSHFGHGILTFFIHYLFRTESGVGLWARGSPNLPKDGISPLEGIVETDWLNFTFTMNWMFTRPGRVSFAKDEPFCFLVPLNYHSLDEVEPEILPIQADPELAAALRENQRQRTQFLDKLAAGDSDTLRIGWQKSYMRGQHPSGKPGNPLHVSKLRLAAPKSIDTAPDSSVRTAPAGTGTTESGDGVDGKEGK